MLSTVWCLWSVTKYIYYKIFTIMCKYSVTFDIFLVTMFTAVRLFRLSLVIQADYIEALIMGKKYLAQFSKILDSAQFSIPSLNEN